MPGCAVMPREVQIASPVGRCSAPERVAALDGDR